MKLVKVVIVVLVALWQAYADSSQLSDGDVRCAGAMTPMASINNKIFAYAKSVEGAQSDDSEMRELEAIKFEKDPNDILMGMGQFISQD